MRRNIFLLLAAVLVVMLSIFMLTVNFAAPKTMTLAVRATEPRQQDSHLADSGVLRVVILSADSVYCYSGNVADGKWYSISMMNAFRDRLLAAKNKWKDSLFVSIGPSAGASYDATVRLLDEMSINNISRYELADLTKEELGFLPASSLNAAPPRIETPATVVHKGESIGENEIRLDLCLGKGLAATLADKRNNYLKDEDVNEKDKLSRLLKRTLQIAKNNNQILTVRLFAGKSTGFKEFEWIVKELRTHEIYKYQLITTEE